MGRNCISEHAKEASGVGLVCTLRERDEVPHGGNEGGERGWWLIGFASSQVCGFCRFGGWRNGPPTRGRGVIEVSWRLLGGALQR
jgi:hypothetical protein